MKLLALFALLCLAALLAANLVVWRVQERIVFQPTAPPYPGDSGSPRITYRAEDGQGLFAYVLGDRARATEAMLVFHGNADLAANQIGWAGHFARRAGVLVVAAEYRGYAGLGGTPTYVGAQRDARAAYAAVRDSLGIAENRITVFGHSLGSAIAAELAADVGPRALVLMSPFTSVRAMAEYLLTPRVPAIWNLIARVHWDTERRVAGLDTPVWVVHGTRDMVIPVRMGRLVYAAAKVKGEWLEVPGAGHNDVAEVGGDRYERWLAAAIGRSPVTR